MNTIENAQVSKGIITQFLNLTNVSPDTTFVFNVVPGQIQAVSVLCNDLDGKNISFLWGDSESDQTAPFVEDDGTTPVAASTSTGFTLVCPGNQLIVILSDIWTGDALALRLTPIGY